MSLMESLLRRINNVIYDISDTGIDSNGYYIEVDRSATYGVNRSIDIAQLQLYHNYHSISNLLVVEIKFMHQKIFNSIP